MGNIVARVELLIQDDSPGIRDLVATHAGRETKELSIPAESADRFLDGPACRRVAIVDFDPATGQPAPAPAKFVPAKRGTSLSGKFVQDGDPTSPATLAVNAFGTVFETIAMFEGDDALGRPVTWAFGSEQLLVLPRAGEWANSCYDRSTRSLQFFWFQSTSGATVYTALSRDIVAHECGHALLDAVVPSLYDSATPQSIAIHEAVADLVAILMALDSHELRTAVLARSMNKLSGANAFNAIAEEFGTARPGPDGLDRRALRDLHNKSNLPDLKGQKPHILSTLLSSIFYDTLGSIFDARFAAEIARSSADGAKQGRQDAAANKALGTAQIIFRRLLLRGIDYLPPGELTFADVGRATLAADRAAWPDRLANEEVRQRRFAFADRFVDRRVVNNAGKLDSTKPRTLSLPPTELTQLRDHDYFAYEYVNRNREAFGIPSGIPFTVLPRVDATKRIGPKDVAPQRELIIKVAWNHLEATKVFPGAQQRIVPTGATLALHWETGKCLALVRSDVTNRMHRAERDALMSRLRLERLLDDEYSTRAQGVGVQVAGNIGSLSRTHRLLHMEDWDT